MTNASIATNSWRSGSEGAVQESEIGPLRTPVVLVVGFDGSDPAGRALESAARLLHGRSGWLEVVYVAHVSATAQLSPTGMGELTQNLDDVERELHNDVSSRLASAEALWHFRRRNGTVGHELLAVAEELRRQNPDSSIVLVVGGSAHKYHRVLGSVASKLEQADRFPVIVVP